MSNNINRLSRGFSMAAQLLGTLHNSQLVAMHNVQIVCESLMD